MTSSPEPTPTLVPAWVIAIFHVSIVLAVIVGLATGVWWPLALITTYAGIAWAVALRLYSIVRRHAAPHTRDQFFVIALADAIKWGWYLLRDGGKDFLKALGDPVPEVEAPAEAPVGEPESQTWQPEQVVVMPGDKDWVPSLHDYEFRDGRLVYRHDS